MKVSLILCTKNGGERLKTCLRHIEQLDADRSTQVLLVDNGSTDGHSFEYLKQFEAVSRFDCRVLQTFTPGNSAGRNLAIEQAAGELLVFIDDDCYAAPDLLENWIEVFAASDISFGSGMITRADAAYSDLGCNEHPNAVVLDPGTFVQRGFIQGSNMAFRKSCFAAVGLLDERFGAGTPFAGEEMGIHLARFAGRHAWRILFRNHVWRMIIAAQPPIAVTAVVLRLWGGRCLCQAFRVHRWPVRRGKKLFQGIVAAPRCASAAASAGSWLSPNFPGWKKAEHRETLFLSRRGTQFWR